MRFEVYGKQNCAKCDSTKAKLAHFLGKVGARSAAEIVFVDMDSVVGRAEGAFYDVHSVPTTILRSETGAELSRWKGEIPHSDEIKAFLAQPQV